MRYDAIVVGAGPAGTASAIELARHGYHVALVEKAEFPRRKVCGEFISATSIPVLERFGIADMWRKRAGPEVRRVGLYAGNRLVASEMPRAALSGFGRALGRDVLDGLMRDAAVGVGVDMRQPCRATGHATVQGLHVLEIDAASGSSQISAPVLIAAHGSWERSAFPCPPPKMNGAGDMLGFKAHFRGASMASDLMPLLSFPGGYGGMVWADDDRLSLSCCIRRDVLEQIRGTRQSASEAVHRHLMTSCRGIREALADAVTVGPWLAAGPIRPGMHARYHDDIFRVGNVAGEAHPVIAEGISMAIQSGWLLAEQLRQIDITDSAARQLAGHRYSRSWQRQFSGRIRASGLFAALATRPQAFAVVSALIQLAPSVLTLGARLSGKSKPLGMSQSANS